MKAIYSWQAAKLDEQEIWPSLERLNISDAIMGRPNAPRTYSVEVKYNWF